LSRHDAALLALLALEGPLQRRRAAALLWPDSDARHAALNLRQRLHRLRRGAGCDVVQGDKLIALSPNVAHDLGDGNADGEVPPADELLAGLDDTGLDLFADWLGGARLRWLRERRERWVALCERHEAAGRLADALGLAMRLVDDDPSAEHAHRRVMRLHYLRGDRAAAIAAFERCRIQLLELLVQPPGAETLALVALIARSAPPALDLAAAPPVALLRPPRVVGRDLQHRAIDAALAAGRVVLLCGAAGIGKSRLMAEWTSLPAAAPAGGAIAGDRDVAYATAARWLASLRRRLGMPAGAAEADDLSGLLGESAAQATGVLRPQRLAMAARHLLEKAAAAGLWLHCIDDLHHADDASLELLLRLCAMAPDTRVRWLLSTRDGERPFVLQQWLAEQDSGRVEEVRLDALDGGAIAELLSDLALPGVVVSAWAQPLYRHAGGNPMALLETLRAACVAQGVLTPRPTLPLPVPTSVGRLVDLRLRGLGAAARRLAQLAALAGADFSLPLAARVLGVHLIDLADPWAELEAAQFTSAQGFVHDLVREACRDSVPRPVARELHAQIAAAAAEAGAPPAHVAGHWRIAGHWAAAAPAFLAAANAALHAGRRREEAELLVAAADCFDRAGLAGRRFATLCERIGSLVQYADADTLRAALAELGRLPAGAVQAALRATTCAEAQIVFGEFEAVVQAMPAAVAAAVDADDVELALLAARRQAVALVYLGRQIDAARVLEARLPALETLSSMRPRYEFLGEYGTVLERCNRRREGLEVLQRGLALALSAGDVGTAATMHVNLGVNRVYWGDAEAAVKATETGLRLRSEADGLGGLAAGFDMTLGAMCRDAGDFGQALDRLQRSLATFEADGNALWAGNAQAHLAVLWLQLGQAARAARLLGNGDEGLPPFIVARRLVARGLLERALGRPTGGYLDRALAVLAAGDRADVRLAIELERCRERAPAEACRLAEAVAEEAQVLDLMGHATAARVLMLFMLCAQGRDAEAAARWPGVCAAAMTLAPSGLDRPTHWLQLACAAERLGNKADARTLREHEAAWTSRAAATLPAALQAGFLSRVRADRRRWGDPTRS
jgi:DNA-binding SARP family transcriptional activator